MVAKRAVRQQQNTSHASLLASLEPVADAFNVCVDDCSLDADVEAVHGLRTGSRRIQASLQAALRVKGTAMQTLRKPAKAWMRQLKKVRQAAGVVRDLDVQRQLLEDWAAQEKPGGALQPQVTALAAWLRNKRETLAPALQKQARKRRQRLIERQDAVFLTLASLPTVPEVAHVSGDDSALNEFSRATKAMPALDAGNLHDFRKATKKARYVAEAAGRDQPRSQVAKALKRVQDAIGIWHDWQCLANECERLKTRTAALTARLTQESEQQFAAAINITEDMRNRLLKEWRPDDFAVQRNSIKKSAAGKGKKRA